MNDDLLQQIRKDIEFLLTFVPAKHPDEVEKGLAPMFYVTSTYEGDVQLAERVGYICERYGLEQITCDDEEDFVDVE
jgi:hypothetical protein